MVRPKRINIPYSLYHVLSRSNSGDVVFRNRADHGKFLFYLSKYCKLLSIRTHAWCLMGTHFHLLLESASSPSLSEFMRRLLTAYTIYYNRRYNRHGHLFQGRFKSYVVDKKSYLLSLSRYIHLNPLDAREPKEPEKYEGSSMRYYLNGGEPPFLDTSEILSFFKGNRKKYAKFVREGLDENLKIEIVNQRYIGDEAFVARLRKRLKYFNESGSRAAKASRKTEEYIRESEEKIAKKILSHVAKFFDIATENILRKKGFRGDLGRARTLALFLLHENLPWSYPELAVYLGLKNKSAIDYHLRKMKEHEDLKKILRQIQKKNR
ncbi:transposase [Candidatus Sumerlaeota bacterium]|nr:transposase [Candidatus Sumerlaeota bacterium]